LKITERNMKYQAIILYPSISKGIELCKPLLCTIMQKGSPQGFSPLKCPQQGLLSVENVCGNNNPQASQAQYAVRPGPGCIDSCALKGGISPVEHNAKYKGR